MSPVNYNFKRGVDLPAWHWLNQFPLSTISGMNNAYDGTRFIYFTHSTQLYRYDTWTNQWQYLAVIAAAAAGSTMEYDGVRNCLWFTAASSTSWYCFNLNLVPLTVGTLVADLAPFSVSALLVPVLPIPVNLGSSFEQLFDTDLVPLCLDERAATSRQLTGAGTTVTSIDTGAEIHAGMVGSYIRFTSGGNAGQQRVIKAAVGTAFTHTAFGVATAAGDTYTIEPPGLTTAVSASGGSATTLVSTGSGWTANFYRNSDVIIVTGTGAGQRRRIASNTADTLTLSAVVEGNPRTGPWATAPDLTSTFRIVPSSDFLYYTLGLYSVMLYRIDLVMTNPTWVATSTAPAGLNGGSNLMSKPASGPFSLYTTRGGGFSGAYRYDIGIATWATMPWFSIEVMNTGANAAKVPGRNRIFVTIAASQRCYLYNFVTGVMEPVTSPPYTVPVVWDGQRARVVKTPDGVEFIYLLRAGGQEFWRLAMEWL